MKLSVIKARLAFWQSVEERYQAAYIALIEGGVKHYMIDDRQLTRFDLADIQEMIEKAERNVETYEALAEGRAPRKAFGVVPRDI